MRTATGSTAGADGCAESAAAMELDSLTRYSPLEESLSFPRVGEQKNRFKEPVLAQVLAEIRLRLLSWYQETADVVAFDADRRDFG